MSRVGRNASTHLQGLQGPPLLYMYDIYQVEAFLPLKSLQVKHILYIYILRVGGGYNMVVFSDAYYDYFKLNNIYSLSKII